jgi:hypothetical protein
MKRKRAKAKQPTETEQTLRLYRVHPSGSKEYRGFPATPLKETKREAIGSVEGINRFYGYERNRVPYDFRSDKEKYHSHMVIVVKKDELPDFTTMTKKQTQQWYEDHDVSGYLWRSNQSIFKNFMWALRHWKFVKPKPLKKGEIKEIHSLEEIPDRMSQAEAREFWRTHTLSEELKHKGRKGKRKRVEQSSDLPDWSRMVHKQEMKWWETHEITDDLWKEAAPRERTFVYAYLNIVDPEVMKWKRWRNNDAKK